MRDEPLVCIGTYADGEAEGIFVYRQDPDTGALRFTGQAARAQNPSYLAPHPSGRYLYAVNEVGEFAGKPGGGVRAFAFDPETGGLSLLNQQASHGAAPCYIALDRAGRHAVVANYTSGSVAVLPIGEDGHLAPASDVVQHHGSGADPARQEGPHAHSIHLDPANRFALAADLGLDRVFVYRFGAEAGRLAPAGVPWATTRPGAGPRHFAFHPNGTRVYVINELDSTMDVFAYDADTGALAHRQTLATLPDGFAGPNFCADVHAAPSGRFVYGSNRGHDSIAIFAVDLATGDLAPAGHEPTQGRNPRNFCVDPTGRFLFAANQDSDTVVTFRVDADAGGLEPAGHVASVSKPVCVKVMPRLG